MQSKVAAPPDKQRTRHGRIDFALLLISAISVVTAAVSSTALIARREHPQPGEIVLVAVLGALAAVAVICAAVGIASHRRAQR